MMSFRRGEAGRSQEGGNHEVSHERLHVDGVDGDNRHHWNPQRAFGSELPEAPGPGQAGGGQDQLIRALHFGAGVLPRDQQVQHLGPRDRYAYFLTASNVLDSRTGTVPFTAISANGISVDTFRFTDALASSANSFFTEPCTGGPSVGIVGTGPFVFTAVAQGNIDDDATLDYWSISNSSRVFTASTSCEGGNSPAGTPFNEMDDGAK